MWEIRQGSYTDYVLLFGGERDSCSNAMAGRVWKEGGGMYYLLEDGLPGGFLLHAPEDTGRQIRLAYLYTVKARRGRGIAKELFRFFVQELPRLYQAPMECLWAQAGEAQPCYAAMRHLYEEFGFRETSANVVFSTAGAGARNWQLWDEFAARKGKKYFPYFRRLGYEVVSLAEAPRELLEAVKTSERSAYGNDGFCLRPYLEHEERKLCWSKSFVAHKAGQLASITLITHPDRHRFIFEHISVARPLLGRGISYLAAASSMSAISPIGRVSVPVDSVPELVFTMYENNDRANAFRNKMLGYMDLTRRRLRNYRFYLGGYAHDRA